MKNHIRLPRSVKKLFPNVKTAIDAEGPVEVSVTQKDCKEGKKFNPADCALAKAAKREFKADAVIIGMSSSYIIKNDVAVRFQTPASVQREIISFDRHHDFAPGDYYLTPKSPTVRLGRSNNVKRNGSKSKTAKRKVHHSARVRLLAKGTE